MARTLRSELAANESLAAARNHHHSTREDWRKVLERRDAKRQAFRNTHPPIGRTQRGHASLGMLATLATAVGSLLAFVASLC